MGRAAAILAGVLVLALVAGGLTEATLAVGHQGVISDDTLVRAGLRKASPTPSVSPSTAPKPTSTATPSASVMPTPTPSGPKATTNAFVHLRASNSTTSAIIDNLNGGTVVTLLPYSDAQWQQVQYNGETGYVFKTYLIY